MTTKPLNILFIMPDQLRADFVGCYGADFANTPNIDRLAQWGTRYTRAISPSPICVPARAALLTGMNGLKTGVLNNSVWLHPQRTTMGIKTWAETLSEQDYLTAAIGKMHFYPWDIYEGFQFRRIAEDKRHISLQDDYAKYLQQHGLRKYHGNEHDNYFEQQGAVINRIPPEHDVDQWIADETCQFLKNHDATQPFAAMVGFAGPHCPYDPAESWLDDVDESLLPAARPATPDSDVFRESIIESNKRDWNQVDYTDFPDENKQRIRKHYVALLNHIDRCIGEILDTLQSAGLADNTVVIFASDHGDFLGDYDYIGKNLFYDAAIHVPLIVAHPAGDSAQEHAGVVSLTDVNATILAIAGAETNDGVGHDSVPLPGIPNVKTHTREYVFGAVAVGYVIDDGEYKLCKYNNGDTHLFHLPTDLDEQHNLAYQFEHIAAQQRLERWMQQEISTGTVFGHQDKLVRNNINILDFNSDYSKRGWSRPYPAQL